MIEKMIILLELLQIKRRKPILYKDKLPCDPLLHFDSKDAGTIKWTWRTKPAEAIFFNNSLKNP